MANKTKDLIRLIENGPYMFYDHFEIKTQTSKIEIQWINFGWRFCLVPYSNQWTSVQSPTDILGLNLNELERKISNFLLSEYYCYHNHLVENEFRKRKIEQVLGTSLCFQSLQDMERFKDELKKLFKKTDGPKLIK